MKIKIIDPAGVQFAGKTLPKGSVHDIGGPHAAAWLRFKQAELVAEKPAKEPTKPAGK